MINISTCMIGGTIYNLKKSETKAGKSVAKFTVTTWKKGQEGKDDTPQFHNCVAYAGKADAILKFFKDKDSIIIEGSIEYFENKDKIKFSNIVVKEFYFA